MGFLATQWGRKKAMKLSKQAAQQHIFDKKAHGRNMRKGDAKYEAKCSLCNHNDENQAHIMLRCDHPAMKYWRDEYFRKCNIEIQVISNKGTKDYLEGMWTWIAQPQVEGEDTSDNMDSRRIALMMARPIQEDLVRPGPEEVMTPGQIKTMQGTMLTLWQISIEYAATTWRTRGRLRFTPDQVNEWYHKGPITKDIMRGIFEYEYRAKWEHPVTRKKIDDQGFTIHKE
jgi:hypothetical protein